MSGRDSADQALARLSGVRSIYGSPYQAVSQQPAIETGGGTWKVNNSHRRNWILHVIQNRAISYFHVKGKGSAMRNPAKMHKGTTQENALINKCGRTRYVAATAMLLPLVFSELMAYYAINPSMDCTKIIEYIYLTSSTYFPFSTISRHAIVSAYPHSIAYGMFILWTLSPLTIYGSFSFVSTSIYLNKKTKPISFKMYVAIFVLGISVSLFSLLYYPGDAPTVLCSRCESKTIFKAILIKYSYFWLIGIGAGQIFSAIKRKKTWPK